MLTFDPSPGELRCLALILQRESAGRYDVLTGGATFPDYSHFPEWAGHDGSHAAGGFQFEPATYAELASKLGLADFSPLSQSVAALTLLREIGPNSPASWAASGPYPTPAELEKADGGTVPGVPGPAPSPAPPLDAPALIKLLRDPLIAGLVKMILAESP